MLNSVPLWTAVVTPMRANGVIDYPSFEPLLREQAKAGNGIVLLGSTGEGMALEEEEKKEVVRFARRLDLPVPLMAGVPGHQLQSALRWAAFCREEGIQALLAVTPYYAKPGLEGQVEWFGRLLDETPLPVMLYNVPSRSGTRLHPEALARLTGRKNLWALKESSGSLEEFKKFRQAAPELRIYCGDDGLMPEFAAAGAVGLVSVASNVWPEATRLYVERCLSGDVHGLMPLWQEATDALFLASNPVPTKSLLYALGRIARPDLRPPLSLRELNDMAPLLAANGRIETWFKEEK